MTSAWQWINGRARGASRHFSFSLPTLIPASRAHVATFAIRARPECGDRQISGGRYATPWMQRDAGLDWNSESFRSGAKRTVIVPRDRSAHHQRALHGSRRFIQRMPHASPLAAAPFWSLEATGFWVPARARYKQHSTRLRHRLAAPASASAERRTALPNMPGGRPRHRRAGGTSCARVPRPPRPAAPRPTLARTYLSPLPPAGVAARCGGCTTMSG
jgi:hypothetical protein